MDVDKIVAGIPKEEIEQLLDDINFITIASHKNTPGLDFTKIAAMEQVVREWLVRILTPSETVKL